MMNCQKLKGAVQVTVPSTVASCHSMTSTASSNNRDSVNRQKSGMISIVPAACARLDQTCFS